MLIAPACTWNSTNRSCGPIQNPQGGVCPFFSSVPRSQMLQRFDPHHRGRLTTESPVDGFSPKDQTLERFPNGDDHSLARRSLPCAA